MERCTADDPSRLRLRSHSALMWRPFRPAHGGQSSMNAGRLLHGVNQEKNPLGQASKAGGGGEQHEGHSTPRPEMGLSVSWPTEKKKTCLTLNILKVVAWQFLLSPFFILLKINQPTSKKQTTNPGVQLPRTNSGQFHFRRAAFSSILKSRVGNILPKAATLSINLNLDGVSISHTHPSHSQTSRLLTSSLSLGIPVPRPTQCMRVT